VRVQEARPDARTVLCVLRKPLLSRCPRVAAVVDEVSQYHLPSGPAKSPSVPSTPVDYAVGVHVIRAAAPTRSGQAPLDAGQGTPNGLLRVGR